MVVIGRGGERSYIIGIQFHRFTEACCLPMRTDSAPGDELRSFGDIQTFSNSGILYFHARYSYESRTVHNAYPEVCT